LFILKHLPKIIKYIFHSIFSKNKLFLSGNFFQENESFHLILEVKIPKKSVKPPFFDYQKRIYLFFK